MDFITVLWQIQKSHTNFIYSNINDEIMASMMNPFTMIKPGPLITKYSDWILFTILIFFFWAVAGLALKKRFGDSRHLRVLLTSVSFMLAVGTYYSIYRGWLHLSLQGLGLIGAFIVFIMIFFIMFGMMRGYGMKTYTALPLGFVLFYVSIWVVSPNIIHNIIEIHPLLNGILMILFIVSIVKSVSAFFHHSSSPAQAAKELKSIHFTSPDDMEIDREIKEDKVEEKNLKKKTMKVTKLEINKLEDVEDILDSMNKTIKAKGNDIDQAEINQLVSNLREINKNEALLTKGLNIIRNHLRAYHKIHKQDIPQLQKRLAQAKTKNKQHVIQEEINYQKKMIQILEWMNRYESKIIEFTQAFNKLLFQAMQGLRSRYPNDAMSYINNAHQNLISMKSIYQRQKEFEKYLIKLDKKTISDLKREKRP